MSTHPPPTVLCTPSQKYTHPFLLHHQVITYFAGRVFDPNEAERGRVAFAGEYLKGDASLLISDLTLTDSGEYSCKVKNGAQYHWSTIRLIVLGKRQTQQHWRKVISTSGNWRSKTTIYKVRTYKITIFYISFCKIDLVMQRIIDPTEAVCSSEWGELNKATQLVTLLQYLSNSHAISSSLNYNVYECNITVLLNFLHCCSTTAE